MCRNSLFAGVVIASAVTFSAFAAYADAACGWQERGSLDEGGLTQAVTVGDKVYLLGSGTDLEASTLVRAYDPVTSTWEARAPMPEAMNLFGVAELSGKIYRIGGRVDESFVASADVYDPSANTWASIADLPIGAAFVSVAALNGKLYAIGGMSSSAEALDDVHAYDPATDAWSVVAPLKTARLGHASVTVNGKIYAIGGVGDGDAPHASVEVYDPSTNEWSPVSDLPEGRAALAAVAHDGQIFVLGGATGDLSSVTLSSFLRFDPTTNEWSELAPMRAPVVLPAAAVIGSELLTFGGLSSTDDGLPLDGIDAFPLAAKDGLISASYDEPEGENCPAGGTRVEVGFDTSCNGVLDDGDERSVIYVCRGEDGTEATPVLVESSEEAPGENCPRGGTRVDAGHDIDEDGKLSSDEIVTTTFVCDGRYGNRGPDGLDGTDGRDGRSGAIGSSGCSTTVGTAGSGVALLALGMAALFVSRRRSS